jgi:beta-lactamase regulating signal transducer with metallopeptidase domain
MSRLAFADLVLRDAAALVIVKATIVLALASGAAMAAHGFSAARRHMLWLVALSSCVWLVLSSPVVPAIIIHTPMLAQNVVVTAPPPTTAALPRAGSAKMASTPRVRGRFASTEGVRRTPLRPIPLPNHPLIALWIIGCIALLVRHAIGFVGATRLARRASIANGDETTRELAGVTPAVGVRREVRLGYSTEVETPITFGVARPYVLLPTEAGSWPIERRRAVLVHETAHIVRGDWLSQAIGQLACALFWFHPLAWYAFARLRDEAERAADDAVVRSGMPAFEYAAHLLELARRTSGARPNLVAVGLVSTNHLERRFAALLDAHRSRATLTSRARAVTTSVALAIVCPLASLRVDASVRLMNTPLAHVSTPQPASATRTATGERDTARVSLTPEVRAVVVGQPAPETPQSSIAVVEHPAPSLVVHPDFSGKWKQDTVAGPTVDFVTDSTIITQSTSSISFETRGHGLDMRTRASLHNVTFDGTQATGVTVTGDTGLNFVASAVWVADTLVLTTYVIGYGPGRINDLLTVERMTLGPDRNTLFVTNLSLLNGNPQWGGPHTFVLRRT